MEVSKVHEEVKEFHRRYSTDMNLQEQYPHCIEKVNGYIRDLQKQELSVVVAGMETSTYLFRKGTQQYKLKNNFIEELTETCYFQ